MSGSFWGTRHWESPNYASDWTDQRPWILYRNKLHRPALSGLAPKIHLSYFWTPSRSTVGWPRYLPWTRWSSRTSPEVKYSTYSPIRGIYDFGGSQNTVFRLWGHWSSPQEMVMIMPQILIMPRTYVCSRSCRTSRILRSRSPKSLGGWLDPE